MIKFNDRIITILTLLFIIYSFYHYNKDSPPLLPDNDFDAKASYNISIDPERTDLRWYEKLIINYAKSKKLKEEEKQLLPSPSPTQHELPR